MSETTYAEARGVGLVAGVMLAFAVIVALTLIWTGLTTGPAPSPQGAGTTPTTTQSEMQPAPEELPAAQPDAPAADAAAAPAAN